MHSNGSLVIHWDLEDYMVFLLQAAAPKDRAAVKILTRTLLGPRLGSETQVEKRILLIEAHPGTNQVGTR